MNVYGSGETYIVDNDRRSDFSFQIHIIIYKLGSVIFDSVCVCVGYMLFSCRIHGIFLMY